MTIASYWSLWVRVPAYIIGVGIFCIIGLYGFAILMNNEREKNPKYPNWVAYLLIAFSFLATPAYLSAWDEKRVIAAFAEWLVAHMLYYGVSIGGIAAGYFVGCKVYKRTSRQWLGWVVGILIGLTVVVTVWGVCSKIPGIGWRMEKITEEREEADDDYYY